MNIQIARFIGEEEPEYVDLKEILHMIDDIKVLSLTGVIPEGALIVEYAKDFYKKKDVSVVEMTMLCVHFADILAKAVEPMINILEINEIIKVEK